MPLRIYSLGYCSVSHGLRNAHLSLAFPGAQPFSCRMAQQTCHRWWWGCFKQSDCRMTPWDFKDGIRACSETLSWWLSDHFWNQLQTSCFPSDTVAQHVGCLKHTSGKKSSLCVPRKQDEFPPVRIWASVLEFCKLAWSMPPKWGPLLTAPCQE